MSGLRASVALAGLLLVSSGCTSVKRLTDFRGVKVEDGLEPVEVVDIYNTNWLLLSLLPIASGDPANPDGWTTKFFRDTVTAENQMRMLEAEMARVGATRAVDVATVTNDESAFLIAFLREKIHTTAVLVRDGSPSPREAEDVK